ncbi:hypothetical protein [Endozoicomonas sp. ONNA1]|uniref:hypothetical protein n=1 Tax=Endozoicomonas sp. ONNA1 TaxID=2828740 RepID=UPI002147E630|nr:hypothetical protein [Endozoicomonas sp. ONNA1]
MRVALFLLFQLPTLVYSADDVVSRAKASAGMVSSQVGSADGLKNNYANPMLTTENLSTADGTGNFSAQLGCSSNNKFLEMAIQPLPTGDIRFLHLLQDVKLNGTLQNVTPLQTVSGVCANGLISCNPGSWDNCTSYQWSASDSGTLTLEPMSLSDMGGCYCINDSCGDRQAWNNISSILNDLGGGASAALSAKNPYYATSDTSISDTTIRFYGQKPGACVASDSYADSSIPSTSELSSYINNPNKLNSDAFSTAQSNDLYQGVVKSNLGSTDSYTYKSCDVRRVINMDEATIEDIIGFDGGVGSVRVCGIDCLELVLGRQGDNYWGGSCTMYEAYTRFNVKKPERIISATLTHAAFDDWIQVTSNNSVIWSGPYNNWTGTGRPPGSCELATNWRMNPNVDFTSHLKRGGPIDFKTRVEVTGGGEGYTRAIVKADTTCKLKPDYVTNSCTAFEQEPACNLVEETVDGVQTFRNYAATGLTPLPQTNDIVGAYCRIAATRDWFHKKRKYQCKSDDDYDLKTGLDRSAYIYKNATNDGYKDRIADQSTGQFTYSSGSFDTSQPINTLSYTPMCKTRIPRLAADVTQFGTVQDKTTSSIKYDVFYKECVDNTCPIEDSSEEIIKNCQNINEFAEAATIMQTLRKAGQDIICTSGNMQLP